MKIKNYFQEQLEYRRRERKKKKDDKELLKKLELEEERLEIDVPEASDEFSFKHIIDALKHDPDLDAELHSYLTEEEKETLRQTKKEEKRLVIIMASIISVIAVVGGIAMILLSNAGGGTIEEVLEPKIKEYIKEKYNKNENILSIEQLVYREPKDKMIIKSDTYITTTTNNHHILSKGEEIVGDDINIKQYYDEYDKLFKTIKGNYDIISSNPILSYKDLYYNYNLEYEFIKAMPTGATFEELYKSKKLTVSDVILYQGSINFQSVKTIMNNLSNDSRFFFIKTNKGLPTHVSVISHTEYTTIAIKNTNQISKDINYYELDTNNNAVTNFKLNNVKKGIIEAPEGYEIVRGYLINYDKRSNHISDTKQKTEYFFLSFDNNTFDQNNVIFFDDSLSLDNIHTLENIYDYPPLYTIKAGSKIYVIGTSTGGIANVQKKKESLLCKIGLC